MTELTELNPKNHGELKVATDSAIQVAKTHHLINIKVNEVGHAMTNFPIFMTRVSQATDWAVSAITSFEIEKNLFIKDDKWQATYMPTGMQTYPFFLMNSPQEEGQYTIGIDEANSAFSKDEGESLFESGEKASIYLSRVTSMLRGDINNEVHTYQFTKMLDEMGLIKPMDLLVQYGDGAINTLKGLHTIDEEKLQNLETESLDQLRKKGYLGPVYGMLMSIFQLNAMIRLHNDSDGAKMVAQVKLEAPKDEAAA